MASKHPHVILTRKYRPSVLRDIVGQKVLVRSLSNALEQQQIPQAILLSGVRGVGKTTTARILARGLNCTHTTQPTPAPCGVCSSCVAIMEGRHLDVLEVDAASRTGVGDIRELIESVQYRPVSGRYKVYILDEIHMLSQSAFNALLKTLEEPPEHVVFVGATTEIRKIPLTILSRCQRFDLKRVSSDILEEHFTDLLRREHRNVDPKALAMLARAADGSVRDGLSLLEQALVLSQENITVLDVQSMLGLADREHTFQTLQCLMEGDLEGTLDHLQDLYDKGADPVMLLQDMLDIVYQVMRQKVTSPPKHSLPEFELIYGQDMAKKLSMAHISRAWQMLNVGLKEIKESHHPLHALEMVCARLTYAAHIPSPLALVNTLIARGTTLEERAPSREKKAIGTLPPSFESLLALLRQHREASVVAHLEQSVELVSYKPGTLSLHPRPSLPQGFAKHLIKTLKTLTGAQWEVHLSQESAEGTVHEKAKKAEDTLIQSLSSHPFVRTVQDHFPHAHISNVHTRT